MIFTRCNLQVYIVKIFNFIALISAGSLVLMRGRMSSLYVLQTISTATRTLPYY